MQTSPYSDSGKETFAALVAKQDKLTAEILHVKELQVSDPGERLVRWLFRLKREVNALQPLIREAKAKERGAAHSVLLDMAGILEDYLAGEEIDRQEVQDLMQELETNCPTWRRH